MPQLVDHFIDGGVLGDIGVTGGNIGLRLIVVVIADKILDRVIGKKGLELIIELGRQRFIGRNHKGRHGQRRNDIGHCECFTRSGDTQENMMLGPFFQVPNHGADGAGLIPLRCHGGAKREQWFHKNSFTLRLQ